jgi:hypothetical protein
VKPPRGRPWGILAKESKTGAGLNPFVSDDDERFFVDSVPAFDYTPRFDLKLSDVGKYKA